MLNTVFSGFTKPWLSLSATAWTNFVVLGGSSDNLTLSMMCLYSSYRSLLSDKNSAKYILALAIGSKFAGLVIYPIVPPMGIN